MANFASEELAPLGWLHPNEARRLAELAQGRIVLELGAWKGRSTVAMAATAALLVSVDWHRGDWATQGAMPGQGDTLPEYLANVREFANVIPVIGRFEQVCPLLAPGSFGMVFVDGAHDSASVARDLAFALQATGPTGIVACHDWNCAPLECSETIRTVFGREPDEVADYTAVFRL